VTLSPGQTPPRAFPGRPGGCFQFLREVRDHGRRVGHGADRPVNFPDAVEQVVVPGGEPDHFGGLDRRGRFLRLERLRLLFLRLLLLAVLIDAGGVHYRRLAALVVRVGSLTGHLPSHNFGSPFRHRVVANLANVGYRPVRPRNAVFIARYQRVRQHGLYRVFFVRIGSRDAMDRICAAGENDGVALAAAFNSLWIQSLERSM
jgi:hypothetical protein